LGSLVHGVRLAAVGTRDEIPDRLALARTAARQARMAESRARRCAVCTA
jgi:hypothetical protein